MILIIYSTVGHVVMIDDYFTMLYGVYILENETIHDLVNEEYDKKN